MGNPSYGIGRRAFLAGGIAWGIANLVGAFVNPYDVFARNIPSHTLSHPHPNIKPVNENYKIIKELFASVYGINIDELRYNQKPDVLRITRKEKDGYIMLRAIFWLNQQEMAGFSIFTPKIMPPVQSGGLEEFIRKRCAGSYAIVNCSDKEMDLLPTARGGYDGIPIIPFIEESDGNSKDKEFDGRLQGIVRKNVISGNPGLIKEEWKKVTADEIAGTVEAVADGLPSKFAHQKELDEAEANDYNAVLKKLREIFLSSS